MKDRISVDSKEVLGNNKVIKIVHNGEIYYLRVTKDNKLILTK